MVGAFTTRNRPVMTAETGADNLIMVNARNILPAIDRMAGFTQQTGQDMRGIFTGRNGAIMTTGTIRICIGMIKNGIGKIQGYMAVFTVIAALHMGRIFTESRLPVMATLTRTKGRPMVHSAQTFPTECGMAVLTFITSTDMTYGTF